MKPDYYRYFAKLAYYDGGVSVTFPDFPGCVSHGDDDESAMMNARKCLALHVFGMEDDGEVIPRPSRVTDIQVAEGEAVALVDAYMPPVREKLNAKSVKKTLTLPAWLNAEAERQGVNFSQILQKGLKEYLQIS